MKSDPVVLQFQESRILLQYISDKGKEGAKLREIWLNLIDGDKRVPPACVVNRLNRLVKSGEICEIRVQKPQGYLRRIYDPEYHPK